MPGARYFLTFVTGNRTPWLASTTACAAMQRVMLTWHEEGHGALLAATVMPDHVHALIQLGARLSVGRLMARWKAQARRASSLTGEWQRDFWEHRLRPQEAWEEYGLYMLLKPYRAGLVATDRGWPGWCCPSPRLFSFTSALATNSAPPPEWLGWPEERFADLKTGEA